MTDGKQSSGDFQWCSWEQILPAADWDLQKTQGDRLNIMGILAAAGWDLHKKEGDRLNITGISAAW